MNPKRRIVFYRQCGMQNRYALGTLLIDTSFSIESDQVLLPLLEEDDNFAVVLWYGL